MGIVRNADGTLPAYAWPGGCPLFYLTDDGGVLCPDCANGKNGSEASEHAEPRSGWRLVGCDAHWEGTPHQCDHCNACIESAYGTDGSEA
jgi:hypothetical protein